MGDGQFKADARSVRLHFNSFTAEDQQRLCDALLNLYNISAVVKFDRIGRDNKPQYITVIANADLIKLQSLVKRYMHSSMLYRIGL